MGDAGPETTPKSSGQSLVASTGGAENGALAPGLAIVIDAWPELNSQSREIIVGIARKATEAAKNQTG
jgi:hypothetical protein